MQGVLSVSWCAALLTNHRDLTTALGLPETTPDADVVAAAVMRWGDGAPRHLRGAFAFATTGITGSTTITRDPLGVMPAFWARDRQGDLHVSDSLAVLHSLDGVDRSPDEEYRAALDIRAAGLVPTRTGAVGVHRVPPGSRVSISDGRTTVTEWWKPEDTAVVRRIGIDDAAAQLRDLLVTAVDDGVDAIVRARDGASRTASIAAHLSGGLDSTAVSYLVAGSLGRCDRRLALVASWSPDRATLPELPRVGRPIEYDERDFVDELARDLDVPVWFGPAEMTEAAWLTTLDPAVFPRESVLRECHLAPIVAALGVTDIVSGWGGDELASFNGRAANRAIVRRLRVGALRGAYGDRRRRGLGPPRAAWATLRPGLPDWAPGGRAPEASHQQRQAQRIAEVATRFPELVETHRAQHQAFATAVDTRRYQLALLRYGHLARRIDAWHQIGLRFGLAYHYPLLDTRIVEWALSMPSEVYREGDHSRRVFRRALAGIVPDRVRTTTKDDPVLLALLAEEHQRRATADEGFDQTAHGH